MLTIEHYIGPARGKARGKWTFWAEIDGETWEVYGKGLTMLGMRYHHRCGDAFFYSPCDGSPPKPDVSKELIAHARAQLAGRSVR